MIFNLIIYFAISKFPNYLKKYFIILISRHIEKLKQKTIELSIVINQEDMCHNHDTVIKCFEEKRKHVDKMYFLQKLKNLLQKKDFFPKFACVLLCIAIYNQDKYARDIFGVAVGVYFKKLAKEGVDIAVKDFWKDTFWTIYWYSIDPLIEKIRRFINEWCKWF